MKLDKEDNINNFWRGMGESLNASDVNHIIIQDDASLNVDKLTIGLLSGFYIWSGYTFGVAKKVIAELSPGLVSTEIPHYLLNCDFVSPAIKHKLFNTNQWGYFESCWIENGEVLKRYKYRQELEPFLDFIKNRLSQISKYFEENILKVYTLNPEKQNLGIAKEDFTSDNRAIILSKSKYQNQFLYNLMQFQKEGNYYLFEDDKVMIYEPTRPTHLSSCFIKIK